MLVASLSTGATETEKARILQPFDTMLSTPVSLRGIPTTLGRIRSATGAPNSSGIQASFAFPREARQSRINPAKKALLCLACAL